jgi:CDP-glycerol glycerophosphotransferase (TagB/SpsB family)
MSSKMMMSREFVENVWTLIHCLPGDVLDGNAQLVHKLKNEIQAKIEAEEKREVFVQYKTAAPGDGREELRENYLNKAGLHKNWRSTKETRI